ncbi:MAG: DUF4199 domain-containing protein [Flavobacteriales bacterium]|nr:MAG: DUF4199 domain-containing protein [Flavobacteriales bacterium]
MNPIVKQEASKWGLAMASVSIVFYLLAYMFYLEWFASLAVTSVLFVVNVVLLVMAIRSVREQMDGFIEFKDAFTTAFVANVIASLIGTVVVIFIFNILDPDAAIAVGDIVLEKSVSMAERFGASDSDLEKMVEGLSTTNQFAVRNQVRGFFSGLLFSAAISAVLAAFLKKNKPVIYE